MRWGGAPALPALAWCAPLALPGLSGCQNTELPAANPAGIATADAALPSPDAVLRLVGTEPFWGGSVTAGRLTWVTPENGDGVVIPVERFEGLGGVSFSGMLEGAEFDLTITPGTCSDGMSDRTYPLVATVRQGDAVLAGCAWREGVDDVGPPP